MSDYKPVEGMLDPTFRNGTMTAVGIVIGFSLSFITVWATHSGPWQQADVLAIVPLLGGILFQTVALSHLLRTDSLEIARYQKAIKLFLWGLMLTAAGVSIGILLDVFGVSHLSVLRR